MTPALAIAAFVVSLLLAIMLHELGHFVTARRFGMHADRFFLGFGPTLWSTRRGETEYGIKALWLGGFVRIRGMSELDERRRPLVEEVFDPARLAADRDHLPTSRVDAEVASEVDEAVTTEVDANVTTEVDASVAVPPLPERTWQRMEQALLERGAPRDLAERIVRRTRVNAVDDSPTAGRVALTEVLAGEVPVDEQVGSLSHRLRRGDEQRFFHDKPAWQRSVVLVAGSVMHFVIAIVVLLGMFLFLPTRLVGIDPVVSGVLEDGPAAVAGLREGDVVRAVDDVASADYEVLRSAIQERPGREVELTVDRGGELLRLTVVPDEVTLDGGRVIGQVGFLPTHRLDRMPVDEALRASLTGPAGFFTQIGGTFTAIGRVFGPEGLAGLFSQATGSTERTIETGAVSLVGAAGLAGQTDLIGFLLLVASINVFIGVFNLLPLPPLDGGHLAVLGIERGVNAVRRARGRAENFTVDPRAVAAVAVPFLVVLGFVFVSLLWLDITSPIRL